ncbi:hypothetical protein HMPREF0083_01247 [Aneurinibacillus aneurinilyticus ATCC 12856]|uniref:Uncharacterized protein n=1 Tax=Aneurinibacillus aneurinilyticus ATCC 12856 TaxID=649747 RepID=U1YEX8_ANEAE|nr:hypothetical protein HMPREF0083_01247 [Aneurinibacillus aneurinilyticus ATCC 12856]
MVERRKFGKKKRLDAPCAPAEERSACLFPTAHLPSSFLTSHHKNVLIYPIRCI